MFRRDVFRLVGGYREEEFPAEDYGLWLRMIDVTQVATIPSAQLTHRRSESGLSSTLRNQQTSEDWSSPAAAIERVIGERPTRSHRRWSRRLGPPLGCADCDEALGDVLAAYQKVRHASRARKAPRADLHRELPRHGAALRVARSGRLTLPGRVSATGWSRHPMVRARLAAPPSPAGST